MVFFLPNYPIQTVWWTVNANMFPQISININSNNNKTNSSAYIGHKIFRMCWFSNVTLFFFHFTLVTIISINIPYLMSAIQCHKIVCAYMYKTYQTIVTVSFSAVAKTNSYDSCLRLQVLMYQVRLWIVNRRLSAQTIICDISIKVIQLNNLAIGSKRHPTTDYANQMKCFCIAENWSRLYAND